ncbi:MAG: MFS transporter, partial [Deinococcota bacterium]
GGTLMSNTPTSNAATSATSAPSQPTLQHARRATLQIFLINGVLLSSWVPHIPLVQARLGLGEGMLGLALLATAIGAILAMPVSGLLSSRLGSRRITTITALLFCIALPLPVLAPSFVTLAAALFFFGACTGSMDVAMNAQAVAVENHAKIPVMSSFHGLFSIGGLLGSSVGGLILNAGIAPATHVLLVSSLMLVVTILTARGFLNKQHEAVHTGATFVLPKGPLLALGLLAFLVLIAEGAMADWSAVYLRNALQTGPGLAAAGYAAFSLMMAIGRLTGDKLIANVGPVMLTRVTALIAALGLGLGLIVHHPIAAIIGFGCVGLGLSNLIPVLFSAAGNTPGVPTSTGIAAVATAGYFGFLAGPPLIGLLAELFGLPVALGMVAVAVFVVAVFAHLTQPRHAPVRASSPLIIEK